MTREVMIASVQLPAFPAEKQGREIKDGNFQTAEHWLTLAGESGANIACLGEMFNIRGRTISQENFAHATEGDFEQTLERFGVIASHYQMAIIAPIYALMEGVPRNLATIIDKGGQLLGVYTKVHCTEDERRLGIVPGNEWPVFDLGFAKIGVEICHDNSFPESTRCLALNGAEIIFWPHVMEGWGEKYMEVMILSPAVHNGIIFVPACYGCDPGTAWRPGGMPLGRSSIVGPDATILADAGHHTGIALAKVDLDLPRVAHEFTRSGDFVWRKDMLMDRRPETYQAIVSPKPFLDPIAGQELKKTSPGNSSSNTPVS